MILCGVGSRETDLAASTHPAWDRCKQGAKKMHTRNTCQVLGEHLDKPATILVCWTVDGKLKGGTATAMRIAMNYGIPIYNLAIEADIERLREYYNNLD